MPEFLCEVNFLQFDFTGKRCAVLGLGISNLPLIDFLLDRGALVSARDQKSVDETDPRIAAWLARGVEFVTGDGYLDGIRADYVFRSPGIRPDLPGIAAAVQNGAVLTSEMELFFALCPAKIFAVTGSDGKTTTTTLTYKLLEAESAKEGKGRRVFVGGNIGAPLLPRLAEMRADDFAVVELSSFYLDILKDRLYCESRNGLKRRSAQTALFLILDAMTRLYAPILPFTCDEIWQAMPHRAEDDARNVVLNEMVKPYAAYALSADEMAKWDTLIALRSDVNSVLEAARADKRIGKALEAHVVLTANDDESRAAVAAVKDLNLAELFIVSDVAVDEPARADSVTGTGERFSGLHIEVRNADGVKCPRCWMHSTRADAEGLCPRCAAVLAELSAEE